MNRRPGVVPYVSTLSELCPMSACCFWTIPFQVCVLILVSDVLPDPVYSCTFAAVELFVECSG